MLICALREASSRLGALKEMLGGRRVESGEVIGGSSAWIKHSRQERGCWGWTSRVRGESMGWGEPASFSGRRNLRSREGVGSSFLWGCNVRIGDGRRERLEGEIPYLLW